MLDKHLLAKVSPLANEKNTVFFENYRITALFDRLIRIERDSERRFSDKATQSVWYRNTPEVEFSTDRGEDFIEITTKALTLHLELDFENSFVILDGKKLAISNEGNLLGTTRTLDCYDGDMHIKDFSTLKLNTGVCSRTGLAVVDDTASLCLSDEGKLMGKGVDELDIYLFAYGNNYREAVKALYSICGPTPLLPRYALGNWWTRYHAYSDEEYLYLMDSFEEYGIPLTVATVDMDWHYSNDLDRQKKITEQGKVSLELGTVTEFRMGWTGYSWNPELFPDYKTFLRKLREKNLKVTLNLHPADGVRFFEDMYEEMATALGIDPKSERVVPFDIANDDFVNAYFKILHHPYERDGVDFWWIDWQQGNRSSMEGLDPLWALNHYHYYDNGRDGKHPLILSRYAGIGSHRYPIGFSGDSVISWNTLDYIPYFTATATNAGYTWWGHDIGGHYMGEKDGELYLRFLQFGVFNPINRLHCASSLMLTKEPWAYKGGISELAREAMIYRHRLIPFLHTANRRTNKEGLGLVEPMYYEHPEAEESYEARGQYLFGGSLIVAPITEHSGEGGLSRKSVWLPEGTYTDIFTSDRYEIPEGGKWVETVRYIDSIPVFAKAGTVIPLSDDKGNSVENPKALCAEIYNGDGSYTLYEDDELGTYANTRFTLEAGEGSQSVAISFDGDFSALPEQRSIKLVFKNITVNTQVDPILGLTEKRYAKVTVMKDGKPTLAEVRSYATVSVKIDKVDYNSKYEIKVEYNPLTELQEAKRKALLKLQLAEGPLTLRSNLEREIQKAKDKYQVKNIVMKSDIAYLDKLRLVEDII